MATEHGAIHKISAWPPRCSQITHRAWLALGLCVWLVVVGSGMGLLAAYSSQAGASALPPEVVFPAATTSSGKHRLLMFAHPHCPCTAASLRELSRLMARCTSEVEATVYFARPENQPDSWVRGNLWNSAAAIPGVHAEIDPQGQIAAQFGAATSGDVLLYNATGQLLFQGGITQGRGHEGDSLGKLTVLSIVKGDPTNVDHCPVFGCALRSPARPFRK